MDFAKNFKPTFPVSEISKYTRNPREKTKLKFLMRFEPFSEYKCIGENRKEANPALIMSPEQKRFVIDNLKSSASVGNFEDESYLIERVNMSNSDLDPLANVLSELNVNVNKLDDGSLIVEEVEKMGISDDDQLSYSYDDQDENKDTEIEERKIREANITRFVSTNRGRLNAPTVLEKTNKEGNLNFIKNTEKRCLDFGSFKISGRIDGIDNSTRQIIDIHTRKDVDLNRTTIARHEHVRVLAYMKLFDCMSCLFVECGPDMTLTKKVIEWDEIEFEKEVVAKLGKFTSFHRSLQRDEFERMLQPTCTTNKIK